MEFNASEIEPEDFDGCTMGHDAQRGCESVCYRVMLTTQPYGDCGDFTKDLELSSPGRSWYPPENSDQQGFRIAYFSWSKVSYGSRSSDEKVVDFWHEVMRMNVPDGQQDLYFDRIEKLGHPERGQSAMTQAQKGTYVRPITVVLNAIQLRRKFDAGISVYVSSADNQKALEALRKAIEEVQNTEGIGSYNAMTQSGGGGIDTCKTWAKKMEAFQNLRVANAKGKRYQTSTDEKADAVYVELVDALDKARALYRDKDFKNQKQRNFRKQYFSNAETYRGDIKRNLDTFFGNEKKKAVQAAQANDKIPKAIKDYQPVVERLKKLPVFSTERNEAEQTLQTLYDNAKQSFNDVVAEGNAKLIARDKPNTFKEISGKLAKELKTCKELLPETKEQYEAIDLLSDQIGAWKLLQPAIETAQDLAEKHVAYQDAYKAAKEKQDAEIAEAEAEKPGEKDETADDQKPSKPKPKPKLVLPDGVQEVPASKRSEALAKLRRGIDAAVCAKMDEEFLEGSESEVENAKTLGESLGGLPPAQPCVSKDQADLSGPHGAAIETKCSGGMLFGIVMLEVLRSLF